MTTATPESMHTLINTRLDDIEAQHKIKIVYACESGSRAWGFPSADSDYDVRFIYVRPVDWYLSIDEKRDVIEYPIIGDLDINGWDLKKALQLLRKTNPPLLEWMGSPIIYRETPAFAETMRALAGEHFSPIACYYHYLHMARGNYRAYLQDEVVSAKKYLYSLRPLLAIQWIEAGRGIPPTGFSQIIVGLNLSAEMKLAIANLVERKRAGNETDKGPKIALLSDFIESEITRLENARPTLTDSGVSSAGLDAFFRASLQMVWQNPASPDPVV